MLGFGLHCLEKYSGKFFCSYLLDLNVDRAEDVLLHQKILTEAKDPEKRPVFHVRFIKVYNIKP